MACNDDLRLGTSVIHSPVHRPDRLEFVGIRRFDENGTCVGERQLLGLPTASAEAMSPRDIPVLRRKVADVVSRAAFPANSHDAKQLLEILEAHPRDEMLRLTTGELYDTALRVMALYERPQVGVESAPRADGPLLLLPGLRSGRPLLRRGRRQHRGRAAREPWAARTPTPPWSLNDSPLARLHVTVAVDPHQPRDVDARGPARRARSRRPQLAGRPARRPHRRARGSTGARRLWRRYGAAFPAGYESQFPPDLAARQVGVLDSMPADDGLDPRLRRAADGQTRLTVFRTGSPLRLSDVLPVLENCGSRVVDERPYEVQVDGRGHALGLRLRAGLRTGRRRHATSSEVGHRFAAAFTAVWRGDAENDPLNRLVLLAGPALARGRGAARALPLPAPGRHAVQPGLHGRRDDPAPEVRQAAAAAVPRPAAPGRHRRDRRSRHRRDHPGARPGQQPGRGPHPALAVRSW